MMQKTKAIPSEVLERMAAALRVLAHPHRLRIVELLMDQDLTVGELAEALDIAPSACSGHLNLMRAHGLLASGREGKAVYYRVDDPSAANVIQCIRKHM
jgi:DNA-binding transcriptional ArsR family regulator